MEEVVACDAPVVEAIVRYAAAVPVFPCRRVGEVVTFNGNAVLRKPKSPKVRNGFKDASQNPDQIRAWWKTWPDALVGMPTGHTSGLVAIDYDPRHANADTDEWIGEHADALMSGLSYRTPSGGRHYLFKVPAASRYPSGASVRLGGKTRPGLDIRGEGGYIVYWPLHGFSAQGQAAWLPAGLLDDLRTERRERTTLPTKSPGQWAAEKQLVADALAYIEPIERNTWRDVGMALHLASGGSEDGFALWDAWSAGELTGETPHNYAGTDECRYQWSTFRHDNSRTGIVTLGTVFALAKVAGFVFRRSQPKNDPPPPDENDGERSATPSDDGFQWPVPADFLKRVRPPAFSPDDVPRAIGRYALEWASATGFDLNGVLVSCVSAASAMLSDGLRLLVNPASSYYESARLWTVLIGPPGVAKTPSISAATAPIKAMHRDMLEVWKKDVAREKKRAESVDEDPDIPPRPSLYTSDATIEALAELLANNERGMFFLSEEFESWLGSHDAYRSGGSKDRGEWLRAYDGGPHQVDRVRRGAFFVPNWGIGILSATTPGALQKLARNLPADGLMQRFLPIVVSPTNGDPTDADVSAVEGAYHNTLLRLLEYGPRNGARVVSLSPDAARDLKAEIKRLRQLALDVEMYGEAFSGHVAKHPAMVARLTLIFHALSLTDGRHPADVPVQADTVALAIRFMRKAFRHSLAVYSDLIGNDTAIVLARAVARFLLAGEYRQIVRRDLARKSKAWRTADNDRLRDEAMQFLVDMGWLRELDGQYNKGHVTHWAVNPLIHSMFSSYGNEHKERCSRIVDLIRDDKC